jgi:hypothetical protein
VKEPEDLMDDETALQDLPFVTLFYRFMQGRYALSH